MTITSIRAAIALSALSILTLQRAHAATPNDPRFSSQWYLKTIGAPAAWQTTTGSSNIVVAIIDTGVDYTHPDLAANMWRNPGEAGLDANGDDKAANGVDDDNNGYVDDVFGVNVVDRTGDPLDTGRSYPPGGPLYHGTMIAGLIGAAGNNQIGISGVNWSVQIMAIRFWGGNQSDANVFSPTKFATNLIAAWEYVLSMKRRGVNIRVVSSSYSMPMFSPALKDLIEAAGAEGILCIVAAGNQAVSQDLFSFYPQSFNLPCVLSIAGTTESDGFWTGSNFGTATVHLGAPALNILSTSRGANYLVDGGTSYSAPLVAGAAALILASRPEASVNQLKAALLGSVDQPLSLRGKSATNGRLNVAKALQYLDKNDAPAIILYAAPAGQRTTPAASVELTFSRAMNQPSVEASLLISPPASGTFEWSQDSTSLHFRPTTAWERTNYTVRLIGTAFDAFGRTLDGDFNGSSDGSPQDDFVWTFRFPLPNDDFIDAQALEGASGAVQGTNRYASIQMFEPAHVLGDNLSFGCSVWYSWVAPSAPGWLTLDLTTQTPFDSLLAVYTGDDLPNLVPIAGNDNFGTRVASRVSFSPLPRTRYSIVVANKNPFSATEAGTFRLSWYPTHPPGFTGTQFSPASAAPGAKITLTGTNFTGTTAVLFNGASATFTNAPTNNLDLRITAIVPPDATSGPITVLTPHGNVTSTATFLVARPTLHISRVSSSELTLSWTDTSFVVESSSDLRVWTQLAPTGAVAATVRPSEKYSFFRLRAQQALF